MDDTLMWQSFIQIEKWKTFLYMRKLELTWKLCCVDKASIEDHAWFQAMWNPSLSLSLQRYKIVKYLLGAEARDKEIDKLGAGKGVTFFIAVINYSKIGSENG